VGGQIFGRHIDGKNTIGETMKIETYRKRGGRCNSETGGNETKPSERGKRENDPPEGGEYPGREEHQRQWGKIKRGKSEFLLNHKGKARDGEKGDREC